MNNTRRQPTLDFHTEGARSGRTSGIRDATLALQRGNREKRSEGEGRGKEEREIGEEEAVAEGPPCQLECNSKEQFWLGLYSSKLLIPVHHVPDNYVASPEATCSLALPAQVTKFVRKPTEH